MNNKKITRMILISIIVTGVLGIIVSMTKPYAKFSWVLADAFFGSSLVMLIIGMIRLALRLGGFTSIRYYFYKRKNKGKNILPYTDFVFQPYHIEFGYVFVIALFLFIISLLLSYI